MSVMDGDDHINCVPPDAYEQTVQAAFNAYDRVLPRHFPSAAVCIDAADVHDALVQVVVLALIDARDLNPLSHGSLSFIDVNKSVIQSQLRQPRSSKTSCLRRL